ncbi:MAG: hypothetical protein R3F60_21740 [bacterium]
MTTIPNDDTLPCGARSWWPRRAPSAPRWSGPPSSRSSTRRAARSRQGLLRWTALAAALAAEGGGVVVDLDTLKVLDSKDFLAGLSATDWLSTQVVPQAWRADDGTVGFASRGMARFGLPDVERTGVPAETARLAFGHFQAALGEIQARGKAAVGDQLSMARLVPCTRPPEAYTRACVALGAP